MKYPVNTVLFAAADTPECIEAAKKYVNDNNLTFDDVKVVRRDDSVLVVCKKEVKL